MYELFLNIDHMMLTVSNKNVVKLRSTYIDVSYTSLFLRKKHYFLLRCHDDQKELDACVEANLNLTRPKLGYFSKLHVYDSATPAPGKKVENDSY